MDKTIEVKIYTSNDTDREIIIALLFDNEYTNFTEEEDCLIAYIKEENFDKDILKNILQNFKQDNEFEIGELENKDWNEIWEKSFNPICINNKCFIRSSFHEKSNYPYEIVIDPKMAFGTGHHETTALIVKILLEKEAIVKNKNILDMGCGTAILAILASKIGAINIDAVDNDENAVCNAIENLEVNNVENVNVMLGDVDILEENNIIYDTIIANINRNVLLTQMEYYKKYLKKNGKLIISGFYENDVEILNQNAFNLNFKFIEKYTENNWTAIIYEN